MSDQPTPAELSTRLMEIKADPHWSGALRMSAGYAAHPDAELMGFAIHPADLSDAAVHAALVAGIVARGTQHST